MIKHLALASVCLGLLSVGGCSTVEGALGSAVTFIDAPSTQQAIATLETAGAKAVCAAATAQALASAVESGIGAGQSIQGSGGKFYFASSAICAAYNSSLITTATL